MKRTMEKGGCAGFAGRYDRNRGVVTETEQELLKKKSVCVIGCGGLGGGVIENLTRLGVGALTIVDGDVFEESNLNRQVLSHEGNLRKSKALEGTRQMAQINSEVNINPVTANVTMENCRSIIAGHDVVVDALDNVQTRLLLEDSCETEGIPLVHGAIAGWTGQVAVVMPGSRLMHKIYGSLGEGMHSEGSALSDASAGNPSFTPAIIAGLQAAETLRLLLGKEGGLSDRLLLLDLLEHEYEIVDFGE